MCGVRISNPSPNHMGTWKVFTNELRNGQQMISNNKELSLYTYNQVVIKLNIPFGQLSAKLSVTWSLGHLVT